MNPKKWDFEVEGYSGMNYYCIAESLEEALAKARKQAERLKKDEKLKALPDIISISADGGDYVE